MYKEKFYVTTSNASVYKFFGDFTFDKDAEDCMGTGTLKMPYHPQLWAFWEPGFTELSIYGGTFDEGKLFGGRTRGIKQTGENIEISIQDHGWRLKKMCDNTYPEITSVELAFKKLVKDAGMKPIVQGLKEDYQRPVDEDSSSVGGTAIEGGVAGNVGNSVSSSTSTYTAGKSSYQKSSGKSFLSSAMASVSKAALGATVKTSGRLNLTAMASASRPRLQAEKKRAGAASVSAGSQTTTTTQTSGANVTAKAQGTAMSTQGQSCVQSHGTCNCGEQEGVTKAMSWVNKCPHCGGTNLNFVYSGDNPEGRITCGDGVGRGGCDADYCSTCGKENIIGSTKRLTPCTGGTTGEEQEQPGTFEDEINKMCEDNDLIWYTTQYNECILLDYATMMEDIEKVAFTIKREHMEYPSFDMDVSQFGYANTVVVTYKNGKLEEVYEDLKQIFGRVPKHYNKPNLSKTEARKFAKSQLATLLRDFAMEIQLTVLHTHEIQPGCFVNVENPVTHNKECYYVSGVNVSHSPTSTLKSSLTLLYAPKNPAVDSIPEIGGPKDIGSVLQRIGSRAAQFKYQTGCSNAACLEQNGWGECWAMSDWIYNQLTAAGVRAKIVQYPATSYNHRSVLYYSNGTWVDFPYRQYNISNNFYNTAASKSSTHIIRGG